MSTVAGHHEPARIQEWLLDRVGYYLQISPTEIGSTTPLAEIGMDSVFAVSLCGDIEEELDLVVEPTLAWDYPTVEEIAGYLHRCLTDGSEV